MARRRSVGGGRVIDFKAWLALGAGSASVSTNATQGGTKLDFASPGTILRIRGSVYASLDATQQVGDEMTVTWAVGMVSTDAAAVGATALPDPADEPEYPWLWWYQMNLFSSLAAGVNAWGTSAQLKEIDTKAMRRFKPGQSLVLFSQTTAATGAPVTRIRQNSTRVLIGT